MGRRAQLYAVFVLFASLLATPAVALAASGGTGLNPTGPSSGGGSSGTSGSGTSPGVLPGSTQVSATGNGVTLTTSSSALLRRGLSFSGSAPASDAGQTIEIERLGHQTGWQWTSTARTTVAPDGSFSVTWSTDHIGRFQMRAVLGNANSAGAAAADPQVTTTVYRVAIATIYGPGFYGQRTACGRRLTRSTIGVANRTLPCGTKVALLFHGRTMMVPVIDRGPYANNADWDLTTATASALGMNGTANIGAVSVPAQPVRAA